jgi:hypothetical protein
MEFKGNKSNDFRFDTRFTDHQSNYSSVEELSIARSVILQLKDDKKKLQEALRTVITERNKKSEKVKVLREKYAKIASHLKNEFEFIQSVKKDFQDFKQLKEKPQKSQNVQEIKTVFDMLKTYTKSQKVSLKFDEELIDSLKNSVKTEAWDEFAVQILRFSIKSAKKQQEFNEQDTPQFHKQLNDSKIDHFLENSKSLLDSLSAQQERLKKLSEDYYKTNMTVPKHMKALSTIPKSFEVLTPSSSSRNIRSSLGDINIKSQIHTSKAGQGEFFGDKPKARPKRIIKSSNS